MTPTRASKRRLDDPPSVPQPSADDEPPPQAKKSDVFTDADGALAFDTFILPKYDYIVSGTQLNAIRNAPNHFDYSQLRMTTAPITNQSAYITLKRDDFLSLMEQLVKNKAENYLREQRIVLLENVLRWCLNFITFFQTFSSLIFFNKLPISAAIFSLDMFNVPFDMLNYIDSKMKSLRTDLSTVFRTFFWTTDGKIIKSNYHRPAQLEFVRNEEREFTDKVARLRNQYESFNTLWHANSSSPVEAQSFVDLLPAGIERETFATELINLCTKYRVVEQGFSPRYLVQQVRVSSMLSLFASTIFNYLPHLKIDMLNEATLEPTLQMYMDKLKQFWRVQTNVSLGPFHLNYKSTNFFSDVASKTQDRALSNFYNKMFRSGEPVDGISRETEQILSQLTFTKANATSRLGFEVKLSNAWRTIFNTSTTKPELMEHSDVELFKTFMHLSTNNRDNLFNQKLFLQFDRIFAGDVLANITFNFVEQNTILKLVIIQLIVRLFLNPASEFNQNTMNLHDPLVMLRDKINCCI